MREYDFSLRQEILMEKGAAVLADLFRRERGMWADDQRELIRMRYGRAWQTKREILMASSENELIYIEAQLDRAARLAEPLGRPLMANEFESDIISAILDREMPLISAFHHPQEHPKAFLLAGQPGSGKTALSIMLTLMLGGDAVLINGDEYRRYHPNHQQHFTDGEVHLTSAFSGAVTERLVDELSAQKYNLIVEGTGRTADVPRRTAEQLTAEGYTVEIAVMAARPEVSLTNTLLRYCLMHESEITPRATELSAHDAVVDVLPGNLDTLMTLTCMSRIRIWDRGLNQLFDSATDIEQPSQVLRGYWSRPWTGDQVTEARANIELLRESECLRMLGQESVLEELTRRVKRAVSNTIFT